jgi:hypothetical protein
MRRIGRLTNDEREERSQTGRALHWIEDRLCEWQRLISLCLTAHERETLIDLECDTRIRAAITHLDAGDGLEARALLLEFLERDATRDAEHHAQRGFVTAMHAILKRFGQFVERSASGKVRNRPRPARAAADQLGLEGIES